MAELFGVRAHTQNMARLNLPQLKTARRPRGEAAHRLAALDAEDQSCCVRS
jgi:hypothetical protein